MHRGDVLDLSRADLRGPDFRSAVLSGVDLDDEIRATVNLNAADLSGADLSRADLRHAALEAAALTGATLARADLSDAHLTNADLSSANLQDVSLKNAFLRGANLRGADLRWANLTFADLRDAKLTGATLIRAALWGANLRGADLAGANLDSADLSYAKLTDADLKGANLESATLQGTELTGANLLQASCGSTTFALLDLSQVTGLDLVTHDGPSVIAVDTLFRSKGKIPPAFLRGVGVPDVLIDYLGSLTGAALEFYSCFISYSSVDDAFAKRLHADLQTNGVRCWFAPEDLKIGAKIRPGIDEAIRLHDKLLLVLSEQSISSDWVEKEVESALEREGREKRTLLFPIRLDDAVMGSELGWPADIRRTRHIGDFRGWKDHDAYRTAFDRLLRDLKAERSNSS